MKTIIIAFLASLLLSSCAFHESDPEAIEKALSFEPVKNAATIYILRDFQTSPPTTLRFAMIQEVDPDSRNKLNDAMDSLDGNSTKGAGIPYDHFFIEGESFIRLEMPPGKYSMYAYFMLAQSASEIYQSRNRVDFKPGDVYFFKINPRPEGAYSSTIYFLDDLPLDEAKRIIKEKDLQLLEFNPIY
ncbi:MAG: hypothetical protein IME94_10675 [Proteobacteria bacterium]|nr:hypothetical protein [Pseudomonadota bacterium]